MIVVDETSTRAEIAEAIGYVRARQACVEDAQVHAELGDTLDDLLGRWARATT